MKPTVTLLLGLLVLGACHSAPPPTTSGLSRQAFVDTYVALREASVLATSDSDFQRRRQQILRAHGATDSALVQFVRDHAGDLAYMNRLWQDIGARVEKDRLKPRPSTGPVPSDSSHRAPATRDSSPHHSPTAHDTSHR